jgi:hypothetical protein
MIITSRGINKSGLQGYNAGKQGKRGIQIKTKNAKRQKTGRSKGDICQVLQPSKSP